MIPVPSATDFDIDWDGDLDFDLKPDFSHQERDFSTRGWIRNLNHRILKLFDEHDQLFHCEAIMYAREGVGRSTTDYLPAWLARGGNSVLANGGLRRQHRPRRGFDIPRRARRPAGCRTQGRCLRPCYRGRRPRRRPPHLVWLGHSRRTGNPPGVLRSTSCRTSRAGRRFANTNLTGAWGAGDMGTYYMHQMGTPLLVAQPRSRNQGRTFANAFHGTVAGEIIKGDWITVPIGPRAAVLGNGSLTLSGRSQSTELLRIALAGIFGALTLDKAVRHPAAPAGVASVGTVETDLGVYCFCAGRWSAPTAPTAGQPAAPRGGHPLVGQELEHVRRRDLHRVLADHREERLQVEATARSVFGLARPATNSR